MPGRLSCPQGYKHSTTRRSESTQRATPLTLRKPLVALPVRDTSRRDGHPTVLTFGPFPTTPTPHRFLAATPSFCHIDAKH